MLGPAADGRGFIFFLVLSFLLFYGRRTGTASIGGEPKMKSLVAAFVENEVTSAACLLVSPKSYIAQREGDMSVS